MLFYLLDKTNLVALLLMVLSFCIILENVEFLKIRRGSQIHLYIALLAVLMHTYSWKIKHILSVDKFLHLSITIFTIGLILTTITEIIITFWGGSFSSSFCKIIKNTTINSNNETKDNYRNDDKIINAINDMRHNLKLLEKNKNTQDGYNVYTKIDNTAQKNEDFSDIINDITKMINESNKEVNKDILELEKINKK